MREEKWQKQSRQSKSDGEKPEETADMFNALDAMAPEECQRAETAGEEKDNSMIDIDRSQIESVIDEWILNNFDHRRPESRTQMESLIDEWILNERDRKILKRRLIDGIKYERLAEEFDLSVRQTKNIVYKNENKLFSKI